MTFWRGLALLVAATVAGGINAVAGGGSLITFPALVWAGLDPIVANTTNTVTLWPGSLAAVMGFRRDLRGLARWIVVLTVPSILGGAAGAYLLLRTPSRLFAAFVPWLILFATALFALQAPITRRMRAGAPQGPNPPPLGGGRSASQAGIVLFQLAVAVYGGYFGAGIGILMLSSLGLLGFTNLHQMMGVRNLLAVFINGIAAAYFVVRGTIDWPYAAVMLVGQVGGGFVGSHVARRVSQPAMRGFIVAVGLSMTLSLLFLR
jgi:hypothetical protein